MVDVGIIMVVRLVVWQLWVRKLSFCGRGLQHPAPSGGVRSMGPFDGWLIGGA